MTSEPQHRHYRAILVDPPWDFRTFSRKGKGRSAEAHYDVMSLEEIAAVPVRQWAADDCMLFLWVTDWLPLWTREAVIEAWEFTFKTKAFVWVKTTRDGSCFPMGTGYYTRANPEDCLLTTRGRPQAAVPQGQKPDHCASPRPQPETGRDLRTHRGGRRGPLSRGVRAIRPA